jgi:hypothetical protein
MRKAAELMESDSCLNRADDSEMLFVLLGRDVAAPATVRFWAQERIRLGKNQPGDLQITEALACAHKMQAEKKEGPQ